MCTAFKGLFKRLITRLKRTENGMTRKGVLIRTVDLVYENDIIMINEGDGESLDPNPDLKADILYEDSEVVVFSKPPFMPCHPSIKHRDDTLGNLFAALYPSLAFRPVNRLDRNTSGCVLVAKSTKRRNAQKALKDLCWNNKRPAPLRRAYLCAYHKRAGNYNKTLCEG